MKKFKIKKVEIVKLSLLVSAFGACLFMLRETSLIVLEGSEPGTYSLCFGLESGVMNAVYIMFLAMLVHAAFPIILHWRKFHQKVFWIFALPILMIVFMPKVLIRNSRLAMEIMYCREIAHKASVFAFLGEVFTYNKWYLDTVAVLFFISSFIIFLTCFVGEKRGEEV